MSATSTGQEIVTKDDVIQYLYENCDMTKKQSREVVNTIIDYITDNLAEGYAVRLYGLGTFSTITRDERTAFNPATGEPIEVESKTYPRFKPATTLKRAVAYA